MKLSKSLTFFILVICFANILKAQNDDSSVSENIDNGFSKIDLRSHFEVSSGFISKISYEGRYYGTPGVGFSPTVTYKHKSGVTASVSNNVWTGFSPIFCQTNLSVSYNKAIKPWLGMGLSYYRSFMYYGSDSDKNSMNNAVGLSIGIYNDWFNTDIEYSYMFGYDKASGLQLGVNKEFSWYHFLGSDKLSFTPTTKLFMGSQTLFYSFISKNNVKKVNRGQLKKQNPNGKGSSSTSTTTSSGTTAAVYEEANKFELLDFQISIPFSYRIGHFSFDIAYNLDFPINLSPDYEYGTGTVSTVTSTVKYIF